MKNREAALQKLSEGLDQIIADHAQRLASNQEQPQEESEEVMPEDEVAEEEPVKVSSGGAQLGAVAAEGPDTDDVMPEAPAEEEDEDEMSEVKKEMEERLKNRYTAMRR